MVSPFIGLFGTVWGIIDAFHGLGTAGSATLRAVAPGISEALITTAAGLFAAIPAVIAYNLFTQNIREFGARMDDFSLELINEIERAQAGAARAACSRWSGGNGIHQRTRPHPELAVGDQRHAAGRRRAGAADHLHGDRAGAAVGHRGLRSRTPRPSKKITEERLVVTIDRDQNVFLNNQPVNINQIGQRIHEKIRDPEGQSVYVRADENVPFGAFATVMDAVKQSGITNVSIVTQPLEKNGSRR